MERPRPAPTTAPGGRLWSERQVGGDVAVRHADALSGLTGLGLHGRR